MKINPNEPTIEDELLNLRIRIKKIQKRLDTELEKVNHRAGFETDFERRARFTDKSKLTELHKVLRYFHDAIEELEELKK